MNDMIKTLIFVGVAFLLLIIGVATYPRAAKLELEDQIGESLFLDFDDSLKANRLEILRFDEKLAKAHPFEVARTKRGWVIPSHSNYPADAESQMRDAVTLLIDLKVSDVIKDQDVANRHEDYGVINPKQDDLTVGQKGVGVFIRLEDDKGTELAELIIGKEVPDQATRRYVRIPKQDPVYVVEVNLDKLSTKFEDWIETDLLKLSSPDVEEVTLKNYVALSGQGATGGSFSFPFRQDDVTLKADARDGWTLKQMVSYEPKIGQRQNSKRVTLDDLEELDEEKLDELKSALADLKIVDVRRKPKGLSEKLDADEGFIPDPSKPLSEDEQQALASLSDIGVFFQRGEKEGEIEMFTSSGELLASTKEGVIYHLMFGEAAGTEEGTDKLNRYLFVVAQLDKDKFPEPKDLNLCPNWKRKARTIGESDKKKSGEGEGERSRKPTTRRRVTRPDRATTRATRRKTETARRKQMVTMTRKTEPTTKEDESEEERRDRIKQERERIQEGERAASEKNGRKTSKGPKTRWPSSTHALLLGIT